jgi:hypothetical protein
MTDTMGTGYFGSVRFVGRKMKMGG